jgi:DNA-binding response OmpR family regulator
MDPFVPDVAGWKTAPGSGSIVIAVAEPDVLLRSAIVESLGRDHYTVLHTGNPKRALRLVQASAQPVALLISSFEFPIGNGLDLCHKCLAHSPGTRVLMMTGSLTDRKEAESKSWDVLQKPFSSAVLRRKVNFLLNR